jgi:hypothetical protein
MQVQQPRPRTAEWLALALVLLASLVATFTMSGAMSAGTSIAVLAVLFGTFVLAIGALFDRGEHKDEA